MTQVALIPNVKIKSEHGNVFPLALIHISHVQLNDSWSMSGENIGDTFTIKTGSDGGTYQLAYYGSRQTFDEKYPICPLREYDGESFSDVLIIDMDTPEVKSILLQNIPKEEKAIAIVRADLERRAR